MAKTKIKKEEVVTQVTETLKGSTAVVFANMQGLTVKETEDLKHKGKANGVSAVQVKKTLLGRAFKAVGITADPQLFTGGVGMFATAGEVVHPAKLIADFKKTKSIVTIFGGMLEGSFIDSAMVERLAAIPGRQELLASFAGTLQAPVAGFVRVLNGNLRGLVCALDQIAKQKS